jgi:MFS family permease
LVPSFGALVPLLCALHRTLGCLSLVVSSTASVSAFAQHKVSLSSLRSIKAYHLFNGPVPVYVSELAPPSKRGRVVGAQQWAITWGILIMFYISYGCSYINGAAAFRVPWGLQMIPAIFLFFALFLLPESPRYALSYTSLTVLQLTCAPQRWLARKDRWEECHDVLALVHAKGDRNAQFVMLELNEIKSMCEFERQNADVSYLELFKPKMINRTHIGVFTQIWSQLTGMNVMVSCHTLQAVEGTNWGF